MVNREFSNRGNTDVDYNLETERANNFARGKITHNRIRVASRNRTCTGKMVIYSPQIVDIISPMNIVTVGARSQCGAPFWNGVSGMRLVGCGIPSGPVG